MKKLLTLMVALLPVLGFAQTANSNKPQRTAQVMPANNARTTEKATVAQPQAATVVLTEEQQHAQWLKNNTHFKTMNIAERNNYIQELEQKISYDVNSPEVLHMRREIKWIKELETQK